MKISRWCLVLLLLAPVRGWGDVVPRQTYTSDTAQVVTTRRLRFVQASSQDLAWRFMDGTNAKDLTAVSNYAGGVTFEYLPADAGWFQVVTGLVENATNGEILVSMSPAQLATNTDAGLFDWRIECTDGTNTLAYAYGELTIIKDPRSGVTNIFPSSGTHGDMAYYDGSSWVNLSPGSTGDRLLSQGTGAAPVWAAAGPGNTNTFYRDGSRTATAMWDMDGNLLTNYGTPTADDHVIDKGFADASYQATSPVLTGITSTETQNWSTAYGWGDHATEGYHDAAQLTGTVDYANLPISAADTANWHTAYGWGDHATEGYHDAAQLTGTVADARLSANVPLLDAGTNLFTGTISGSVVNAGTINAGNKIALTNPPPGYVYANASSDHWYVASIPQADIADMDYISNNVQGWIEYSNAFENVTNIALLNRSLQEFGAGTTNAFMGRVGIGVTNPDHDLHVAGVAQADYQLRVGNSGTLAAMAGPWGGSEAGAVWTNTGVFYWGNGCKAYGSSIYGFVIGKDNIVTGINDTVIGVVGEDNYLETSESSFLFGDNLWMAAALNAICIGQNVTNSGQINSFAWSDGTAFTVPAANGYYVLASGGILLDGPVNFAGNTATNRGTIIYTNTVTANFAASSSEDLDLTGMAGNDWSPSIAGVYISTTNNAPVSCEGLRIKLSRNNDDQGGLGDYFVTVGTEPVSTNTAEGATTISVADGSIFSGNYQPVQIVGGTQEWVKIVTATGNVLYLDTALKYGHGTDEVVSLFPTFSMVNRLYDGMSSNTLWGNVTAPSNVTFDLTELIIYGR